MTLDYAKKLDYVSPVWYSLTAVKQEGGETKFEIRGEENHNEEYLRRLKASNPRLKILPRLYPEFSNPSENLQQLLNHKTLDGIFTELLKIFYRKYEQWKRALSVRMVCLKQVQLRWSGHRHALCEFHVSECLVIFRRSAAECPNHHG